MGFIVGKIILPYLQSSRAINDHIAVICFGRPDPPISAVTVYGPTSPQCTANLSLQEDSYQQLQVAVFFLNSMIDLTSSLLTAYFNTHQDTSLPDKVNSESQMSTDLFPSTIKLTTSVSEWYKTSVKDARSLAGCTLPSDHKLVTMDLLAPEQHGYRWRNTNKLTIYIETCRRSLLMLWLWSYTGCASEGIESEWIWISSSEGRKREEDQTTITQATEKTECIGGSWSQSASGRGLETEHG